VVKILALLFCRAGAKELVLASVRVGIVAVVSCSTSANHMASIDLGRYEDEDEFGSEDEEEEAAGYRAQQQQGESRTSAAGANSRDYGSDEDDDGMASMPSELKGLRACMVCSLIKTHTQFLDEGCDNCESFLSLAERQDRVTELTSHTFEG